MTIIAMEQVVWQNPGTIEEKIGATLGTKCLNHFAQVQGQRGLGISYASCNAAVAIGLHGSYDTASVQGNAFSVVYGSSRLYSGLDPSFNSFHNNVSTTRPFSSSQQGEHAEQTAITTAEHLNLPFATYNGDCHIYIDLTPCDNCDDWLENHGSNWYVHYAYDLIEKAKAVKLRKQTRSGFFGKIMA